MRRRAVEFLRSIRQGSRGPDSALFRRWHPIGGYFSFTHRQTKDVFQHPSSPSPPICRQQHRLSDQTFRSSLLRHITFPRLVYIHILAGTRSIFVFPLVSYYLFGEVLF